MIASRTGERMRGPAGGTRAVGPSDQSNRPRAWTQELAVAAAVGVFLGVVGPFGSYLGAPPLERIAYWTASTIAGTFIFGTAVRVFAGLGLPPGRAIASVIAAAAILSLPFALIVALPAHALWPHTARIPMVHWYLQVFAVAAPLCSAWLLLARRGEESAATSPEIRSEPSRLGVDPRTILCLQMEDHYVRIHHASGSALVLTTMRQAKAALNGVAGLQVHRSWWVAEKAVAETLIEGRNLRLRLTNGLLVPVARTAVAPVRAAGWLDRRHSS